MESCSWTFGYFVGFFVLLPFSIPLLPPFPIPNSINKRENEGQREEGVTLTLGYFLLRGVKFRVASLSSTVRYLVSPLSMTT